jgi:hypothetical protein
MIAVAVQLEILPNTKGIAVSCQGASFLVEFFDSIDLLILAIKVK